MPAGAVYLEAASVAAAIRAFRDRGGKLGPVMAVIAEGLVARVNEEWDSAGHGTWAPLAESTKRKRRGSSYQILKDTGRAAASVRADHDEQSAEAATDVSYMVFHVSDAPRTIIPLRNPFDLPDDAFDEATELLLEHVAG